MQLRRGYFWNTRFLNGQTALAKEINYLLLFSLTCLVLQMMFAHSKIFILGLMFIFRNTNIIYTSVAHSEIFKLSRNKPSLKFIAETEMADEKYF